MISQQDSLELESVQPMANPFQVLLEHPHPKH
jgi:hypothetical protein